MGREKAKKQVRVGAFMTDKRDGHILDGYYVYKGPRKDLEDEVALLKFQRPECTHVLAQFTKFTIYNRMGGGWHFFKASDFKRKG